MDKDKPTDVCKECGTKIWGGRFNQVLYGSLNFCSDACLIKLKVRVSAMSNRVKDAIKP